MNFKLTSKTIALMAMLIALAALLVQLFTLAVDLLPEKKPTFSVENFTVQTEVVDYEYMDDTVNYTGTGEVHCTDTKNAYLVMLAYTDATNAENTGTRLVMVENGVGVFSTYDYGTHGTVTEPQYTFTVAYYTQMEIAE